MSRAEVLVQEMEEQGIDVSINIYHTMMDGYTNIRDEKKCLIVFDRLKVTQIFLIIFHYGPTGTLRLCKTQIFVVFMQECGFKPSIISYGCLINLYAKVKKFISICCLCNLFPCNINLNNVYVINVLISRLVKFPRPLRLAKQWS